MRLTLARIPSETATARYAQRPATSDRDGPPDGVADIYRARVRGRNGESPEKRFDRVHERLLAYDVFPFWLMRFAVMPPGPLADGSVIVQRVGIGLAIESAVCVVDRWDRTDRDGRSAGFSYVTLAGHPECGVAGFEVQQQGNEVWVEMTATSKPGTTLTRIGRPASRLAQKVLSHAGLARLTE